MNAACDGWSDTLAAYRFFDNRAIAPSQILQPHIDAAKQRMRAHDVVLILQDTTELDFSEHPPDDAGCLNKVSRLGIYDHTHLAVTPERLCLGVVGEEQFGRTAENRECPSLPCTDVFDESEWKSVWRVVTKRELQDIPLTLSEFVSLLAQLGGYNNRRGEAPPGPQAIWTGIRRMPDFAIAWINFGPIQQTTYV